MEAGGLSGVLEYEPGEYVFTALAGTPVAQVEAMLAEHGQYLPFDPLWPARGATLGGTVAANTAGPGRNRYGGVRDFLIGVRFIDGRGELVRGGGKVVKNAAGFDLPKLMVGSLGAFGLLVELSFKVFPQPEAFATLEIECGSLDAALQIVRRARRNASGTGRAGFCPCGRRLPGVGAAGWDGRSLAGSSGTFAGGVGRGRDLAGAEDAQFWREAPRAGLGAARVFGRSHPVDPRPDSGI